MEDRSAPKSADEEFAEATKRKIDAESVRELATLPEEICREATLPAGYVEALDAGEGAFELVRLYLRGAILGRLLLAPRRFLYRLRGEALYEAGSHSADPNPYPCPCPGL